MAWLATRRRRVLAQSALQSLEQPVHLHRVVPAAELDPATDALAQTLASKSSAILALGKRAFLTAEDLPLNASIEFLSSQLSLNVGAEDAAEGVSAFLEKRAPEWKDR